MCAKESHNKLKMFIYLDSSFYYFSVIYITENNTITKDFPEGTPKGYAFHKGELSISQRQGIIRRPISLLNVDYKIATKALALRRQ